MVSAGVAYKLAFGVDRSPFPWSDIPKAQVVLVAGANVGGVRADHHGLFVAVPGRGGKLIIVDPRMTPICRNADLYLPVRPGTDLALYMSLLHVILRDGMERRDFISEHTTGFEQVAESARAWDPRTAAEKTGVPPESIERAAHLFAKAERAIVLHARGVEHQSKGVENCLALINLCLATGNIGREGAGCAMITGQGNGQGGREHGQKCDQLPGQRSIQRSGSPRSHGQSVGNFSRGNSASRLFRGRKSWKRFIAGRSKRCSRRVLIRWFPFPTRGYTQEALDKLEFFGVVDFFMSETAHHADVVLAGSLQEEEEGIGCTVEGRVIHIQKAVDPPGNAKGDSWIYCELAKRLGKGKYFPYASTKDIYEELREASRGGHADYFGITYEKIDKNMGVFWPCPSLDHPGTPRLFEDGRSFHPDGKCRFVVTEWRESGDPVAPSFQFI